MESNNIKFINEVLLTNLREDTSSTGDIATFHTLSTNLLSKIYPETFVSQIANIQPSKSPVCKIAALYSSYTASASNNENDVHYGNSLIISIDKSQESSLVLNTTYAISGSNFKVLYKEDTPSNLIVAGKPLHDQNSEMTLVLIALDGYTQSQWESGALINVITPGVTTINGVTIYSYSKNRTAIKKLFFNYSKYTTGTGEVIKPNQVNFETKTINLEAKSRKTLSSITYEKLTDLQTIYGDKSYDSILDTLSNQVKQEIDWEVISYLKDIASPFQDRIINLPLSASIGMQNEITALTDDLYFAIFMMIEEIVKATKRNRTMFILADSMTAAFLQLNPLHIKADPNNNNPIRVGKIGAYPLFVDYYSSDNYMMVGYIFDGKTPGDAGLIFSPYVHEVIDVDDTINLFRKNLLAISRYAYTRHPQDSGTGIGDSDFFKICQVDFRGIKNVTVFP